MTSNTYNFYTNDIPLSTVEYSMFRQIIFDNFPREIKNDVHDLKVKILSPKDGSVEDEYLFNQRGEA